MRWFQSIRQQDKDEAQLKREEALKHILTDHDAIPYLLRGLIEIKNRSTGDNSPAEHARETLLDWDKHRYTL